MSSDTKFVDYIMDQLSGMQGLSSKKMFGEYALYSGAKVVALVCNNQLFVKVTDAGRLHIGAPTLAPPYSGAKPSFLIQDELDNRQWLCTLISLTANDLPTPKPKAAKRSTRDLTAAS
jgi:DNA transformation protein and related proteins